MLLSEIGLELDPKNPTPLAAIEDLIWDMAEDMSYGELVRLHNDTRHGPKGSVKLQYRFKTWGMIPLPFLLTPKYNTQGTCVCCGERVSPNYKGPIIHKLKGGNTKEISECGFCAPCGDARTIHNIVKGIEFDRWVGMKVEGQDTPWGKAIYFISKLIPLPIDIIPIVRTDSSPGGKGRQYKPWNRMRAVDYTLKGGIEDVEYHLGQALEILNFLKKRRLV